MSTPPVPNLTGKRMGIFTILADDEVKDSCRILTVRCNRCLTETTRLYRSVKTYTGKTCIHCQRVLCRHAVIRLINDFGSLTRGQIQQALPNDLQRSRSRLEKILYSLVEDGILGSLVMGRNVLYHPASQRNNP